MLLPGEMVVSLPAVVVVFHVIVRAPWFQMPPSGLTAPPSATGTPPFTTVIPAGMVSTTTRSWAALRLVPEAAPTVSV